MGCWSAGLAMEMCGGTVGANERSAANARAWTVRIAAPCDTQLQRHAPGGQQSECDAEPAGAASCAVGASIAAMS